MLRRLLFLSLILFSAASFAETTHDKFGRIHTSNPTKYEIAVKVHDRPAVGTLWIWWDERYVDDKYFCEVEIAVTADAGTANYNLPCDVTYVAPNADVLIPFSNAHVYFKRDAKDRLTYTGSNGSTITDATAKWHSKAPKR